MLSKLFGNLCVTLELNSTNFEVSQDIGIPQITSFIKYDLRFVASFLN